MHVLNNADLPLDFRVATLIQFSGLLRVGEFTSRTQHTFDPQSTLLRRHVDVVPGKYVRLLLLHSKTDVQHFGQHVYFAADTSPSSAYSILILYMALTAHRDASLPLFMIDAERGHRPRFMTRQLMNFYLKAQARECGIVDTYFSSHSLRIGGATALSIGGVPDRDIQFAGRWRSDTFRRYIRISLERIRLIARAISIDNTSSVPGVAGVPFEEDYLASVLDHA